MPALRSSCSEPREMKDWQCGSASGPRFRPHLFRQLLARASLSVREKLMAIHPELSREIHEVVEEVSIRIESEALTPPADHSLAPEPENTAQCIDQLDDDNLRRACRHLAHLPK